MSTEQDRPAGRRGREPRARHLPARGRRDRQDQRAGRPLLRGGARPRGRRRAHPRLHLHRARSRPAPAQDPGRALRPLAQRPRASGSRPCEMPSRQPTGPGSRPSTGSAAGCSPPTPPPRASIPAFASSTRRRPTGSPRAPSTRRSRRWSNRASAEALELAAANRRRTLLEMTRGAYDELRSHGEPRPALPELRPPDTAGAIAALIEAAREAHDECAEASGKAVASRERIATAMRARPGACLPTTSCSSPSATWRSARRPRRSRARPASATRGRCKRAQAAVAAHGARARLRAAPRAGRALRRALRSSSRRTARPSTSRTCSCRPVELLSDIRRPAGPLPRAVPPPDGRRVPGHQRPPAAADRAAARPRHAAVPGRRRVPVDLRLPPRRRRRLPPPAAPLRRGRGAQRRGAAADGQLPCGPRARRRHQRHRRGPARRLRAADRARARTPAAEATRAVELLLTVDDRKGWEDRGDRAAAPARRSQLGAEGGRGAPARRAPARAGRRAAWTPRRSSS